MIESVRQVHTDKGGNIDKSRGGAEGESKQHRSFLEVMRTAGQLQFEYSDLQSIANRCLSQESIEKRLLGAFILKLGTTELI